MTLTPAQQRQIIAKESAWVDDGFGQLDLTAFPALNELPPAQSHDNRFAKDWRDTALSASATALRDFVSNPDVESLQRTGAETGNTGFIDEVRERKGESVATAFRRQCPDYLPTDANYDLMVDTLAFSALPASQREGETNEIVADLIDGGFWTIANLHSCFLALQEEELLDIAAGSTRALSTAERPRVTRMAQSGRVDAAIGEFLRCSLDGEEPDMDMLNDPAYLEACNAAVYSVFTDTQLDYSTTPEREAYLMRYAGTRPLTLALLQTAWIACQANERRHERGELLNSYQHPEDTPPPTDRELNSLSDAEVEKLYRDSLREYVRSIKGPGVLV
jgi:hypothetical protein